jgi:hypothetical protein
LFVLTCVNIDVWNNLNAEPQLTLGYPVLQPCAESANADAGNLAHLLARHPRMR